MSNRSLEVQIGCHMVEYIVKDKLQSNESSVISPIVGLTFLFGGIPVEIQLSKSHLRD